MSYLKIRQVADLLDVHENTIRNWCEAGLIPYDTYGARGYRRFDAHVIGEAMREGKLPPQAHREAVHPWVPS